MYSQCSPQLPNVRHPEGSTLLDLSIVAVDFQIFACGMGKIGHIFGDFRHHLATFWTLDADNSKIFSLIFNGGFKVDAFAAQPSHIVKYVSLLIRALF